MCSSVICAVFGDDGDGGECGGWGYAGVGSGFKGDGFGVDVEEDVGEADNGFGVVGEVEDGSLEFGAGFVLEVLGE
jgi:hypothetical protein